MPATKEKITETMRIEGVYGPNDWGFFDIKATGPTGEIKLGTKLKPLAAAARGAVGEYAEITFSSKQKGEYTNYYLEDVQPSGDAAHLPAPVDTPSGGTPSSKDAQIARAVGLKCAVATFGPLGADETQGDYVPAVLALAAQYAAYTLHGIGAGTVEVPAGDKLDDDIPF